MENVSIYLSENRINLKEENYQCFSCFKAEYIDGFFLNEFHLGAGHSFKTSIEKDFCLISIPLLGGFEFKTQFEHDFLEAGQALILAENEILEIINPYETETIEFIQIKISNSNFIQKSEKIILDFSQKNQLLKIQKNVFIGKFDGRAEGIFKAKSTETTIYFYIIAGVFEVQNRLLHTKDGLSLANCEEIEFEALSNEAVILIVEV